MKENAKNPQLNQLNQQFIYLTLHIVTLEKRALFIFIFIFF